MNAKIVIPKGWERIPCGGRVARGDRILGREELQWFTPFEFGFMDDDDRAVGDYIGHDCYVIRKLKPRRAKR